MSDFIPLAAPDVTADDRRAVLEVLDSRHLSRGPALTRLQKAIAGLCGRRHAVGVSSGTAALHCAIAALDIGPGDEVLLPSFTVPACANAVAAVGATPRFVDIDARTMAMSLVDAQRCLSSNSRALLLVHPFGHPADVRGFSALAAERGLYLIEDACEALGGLADGKPLGGFGHVSVFGFYPNKQITAGEGGVALTDDEALSDRMMRLRNQGRRMDGSWLDQLEFGLNYRLSDINAALAESQLSRLAAALAIRREVAARYDDRLREVPVQLPPRVDDMSWFCYVVRLPAQCDRDRVAAQLADAGIQTGRYFAPLHMQPVYSETQAAPSLPETERVAARTLALPFFNALSESQQDRIAEALVRAVVG